jgi:hypothetical protein
MGMKLGRFHESPRSGSSVEVWIRSFDPRRGVRHTGELPATACDVVSLCCQWSGPLQPREMELLQAACCLLISRLQLDRYHTHSSLSLLMAVAFLLEAILAPVFAVVELYGQAASRAVSVLVE